MDFRILSALCFLSLAACGAEGVEGDACESDADCGDDLHCHVEDGAGICEHEEHDEEEEE